jgi:hypothetical protein
MNQILHIFKKDTRRFWLEILVASVIEFAYIGLLPGRWKVYHNQSQFIRMQMYLGYLSVLVPVGWWLLTVRVAHAETLVGDEQFWITRPYEWKKLLAAKVLFVVVWIGVPYLLAQSWLLTVGGFHPLSYIPGLLHGLLIVLVVYALPALALAAVTSSFARLTLTLLATYVVYLGFNFVMTAPGVFPATHPYANKVLPVLLLAGCAAVILLQYAMRRVRLARIILLSVPVLMMISVMVYSRSSLIDQAYPQTAPGTSPPVTLSFAPTADRDIEVRQWDGLEHLSLPVHYAGIADGYAVSLDDVRFSITAADGSQWSSPWQAQHWVARILPDKDHDMLTLDFKPEVYDRFFKSGPVTLRISFAATRFQADSVTETTVPAGDAAIPGVGFCTAQLRQMPNLYCRAAIDAPRLTYMRLMWSSSGCADPAHLYDPTAPGSAWIDSQGFDTRLSLVWSDRYWTGFKETEEQRKKHAVWQICPGSPLTLTTYHWLGVGQTELTLTNFVLPASRGAW